MRAKILKYIKLFIWLVINRKIVMNLFLKPVQSFYSKFFLKFGWGSCRDSEMSDGLTHSINHRLIHRINFKQGGSEFTPAGRPTEK